MTITKNSSEEEEEATLHQELREIVSDFDNPDTALVTELRTERC